VNRGNRTGLARAVKNYRGYREAANRLTRETGFAAGTDLESVCPHNTNENRLFAKSMMGTPNLQKIEDTLKYQINTYIKKLVSSKFTVFEKPYKLYLVDEAIDDRYSIASFLLL
jgi:hypothetical protein